MRFEKNAIDQNYLKFEFYKQNAIYSEKYDMRYKINKCTNHFTAKQPKHFIKILFQLLVKIILYGNCVILLAINKLILSIDLKNMYYFFSFSYNIFFIKILSGLYGSVWQLYGRLRRFYFALKYHVCSQNDFSGFC